jgi:uncharacterized membrane protein YesL
VDDLPPLNRATYVRLTLTQLWANLPWIIVAGLIFSVLCLPAFILFIFNLYIPALLVGLFTIAPAWTALLAHEARLVQAVKTNIGMMLKNWLNFWPRSVLLGFLTSFPLVAALLTLPALTWAESPTGLIYLGLAADLVGLLIFIALSLYIFPLLALYGVDMLATLRNALILASRHLLNTIGLLSMGILFVLAVFYINSGLFFFVPAIWGVFIVNNCRMVVAEELTEA